MSICYKGEKNWNFTKGVSPRFLSTIENFEIISLLAMFYLVKKNAILNDKNVDLLIVGFCQKLKLFLFEHIIRKKVFNDVLKSKQTILDEKNVYLWMVIKTSLFQRC